MSTIQTVGPSATSDARSLHGAGALDMPEPDHRLDRIAEHPTFKTLVHERTRFGWILTGLMLFVYFGFIGLIAFDKALLATKVGGTGSLGFYMGMFVIVFAFVLTGIYVARANTRYDRLSADLIRSLAK
ncbi:MULTISPECIES: DUF485 domain-containing protein [Methylorubrum]|jgi:uncharacterized membrane protein (DUF485 family)|nr:MULTISPECIES: DUF485 domain-containing protein [Methylobacteriaceae]MBA9066648.1 uncharacterized membrane protein (DUF485 family) [Methylobacterium sp. RAS18]MDF9865222.1 uncharacterized membrane protein (DUF485 family) [Methylorubrum pseudosasae]MDH6638791.1 uncharacterized membrane protein (DUF485 family) [Methylobacterium sp. SuP10 SLI 274]ABY30957.1 protein of unknown function DUF485 [Methylorubrum extorquens PA1]ACK83625.1 protein of unknown function DUF485 [Methylorubrum extorquens CM